MARASSPRHLRSGAENAFLWLLFFIGFAVNIYFVSPAIGGVPIRFAYMLALLGLLFVLAERETLRCLGQARAPIALICYLGAIGFVLAALRDGASAAAASLIGNHVQALVMLVVAMIGTVFLGRRAMTIALASAVAVSVLFSVLQWLGVGPALTARDYLGNFHYDLTSDAALFEGRFAGLSYSPIISANQTCLTFALLTYGTLGKFGRAQDRYKVVPPAVRAWLLTLVWGIALSAISMIQGDRSPILGLIVFAGLAVTLTRPRYLIFALPIFAALFLAIDPIRDLLGHVGYRIAETGDKSQMARMPLFIYGWRLFLANPYGYGITFDSKLLSDTVNNGDFLPLISSIHIEGIFEDRDLHDYWITMLNMYGVFVIPAAVWLLYTIIRYRTTALAFVPYIVHISFHNCAPLYGDAMFWAIVGIIMASEAGLGRGHRFATRGPAVFSMSGITPPQYQDRPARGRQATVRSATMPEAADPLGAAAV